MKETQPGSDRSRERYTIQEQEQEWWQTVDTSTMDATEYSYFVDSMTADEYARYIHTD